MSVQELTAVAGNTFVVSDATGNIDPDEQHGIFAADTRFLSRFDLSLGEIGLILLRSGAAGFAGSQIFLTNVGTKEVEAHEIELVRQRRLRRTGMTEIIDITNRSQRRVSFPLRLTFDADFADIFEVRSFQGRVREAHTRLVDDQGGITFIDTARESERFTRVEFSVPPDEQAGGSFVFRLELEPRQRWIAEVHVRWTVPPLESHEPVPLAEDIGHESVIEWIQHTPKLRTEDKDLERSYERSVRDLGTLEIALNSGHPIPAAGLPWYLAIFGRDSIITSLQTLMLNQRHARGTLRTLAAYQATENNPFRDSEPGKIAHEIRFGELALSELLPHSRYYGSVDSTPLWLILFGEYLCWTDDTVLRDDLMPVAERCLEWIDRYGDLDGDGLIEYSRRSNQGLQNQGWKDSWDSVRFADGRMAEGPIALVEPQGYVYAARLAMARVYESLDRTEDALTQREKAAELKRQVEDTFWMPDEGYFAMALDGNKNQVDGITSNPGHLLWSGLPDSDKAAKVAERLMSPDLFSGWGIRTMSTAMNSFSPISYHNGSVWPHDNGLIIAGLHRYGHFDAARRTINALIDATHWFPQHRLPELFCGYDREHTPFPVDYPVACSPQAWAAGCIVQMTQIMLGIRATADGLKADPITDRVTSLKGILFRGTWFNVEGGAVSAAAPAVTADH